MSAISSKKTRVTFQKYVFSTLTTGLGMWVIGGLYHNLILPAFNEAIKPHHQGLGITLIAYLILGLIMTYLYSHTYSGIHSLPKGLQLGIIIGILWVFPHGLAMAGTHQTSIIYEIKNTIYHIIEQGVGGIIIYYALKYPERKFL